MTVYEKIKKIVSRARYLQWCDISPFVKGGLIAILYTYLCAMCGVSNTHTLSLLGIMAAVVIFVVGWWDEKIFVIKNDHMDDSYASQVLVKSYLFHEMMFCHKLSSRWLAVAVWLWWLLLLLPWHERPVILFCSFMIFTSTFLLYRTTKAYFSFQRFSARWSR